MYPIVRWEHIVIVGNNGEETHYYHALEHHHQNIYKHAGGSDINTMSRAQHNLPVTQPPQQANKPSLTL
jgi:hypothetical protein